MPTRVKVLKWGNSLGLRLPKSFTAEHTIRNGTLVDIDSLKVVQPKTKRRSRYALKDLLKNYKKPPASFGFPPTGKELA